MAGDGTEWVEIPSEPRYFASRDGRIMGPKGVVLRPGTTPNMGHHYVSCNYNRSRYVHHLVLEAFVGPRPSGDNIVALHADDNPANNSLDNLSWGTQSQNLQDAYVRSRRKTKLCANSVSLIREYASDGEPHRDLARRFGVSPRTIQQVVLRHTWQHV